MLYLNPASEILEFVLIEAEILDILISVCESAL